MAGDWCGGPGGAAGGGRRRSRWRPRHRRGIDWWWRRRGGSHAGAPWGSAGLCGGGDRGALLPHRPTRPAAALALALRGRGVWGGVGHLRVRRVGHRAAVGTATTAGASAFRRAGLRAHAPRAHGHELGAGALARLCRESDDAGRADWGDSARRAVAGIAEVPGPATIAGGALVLGGVILAARRG